MIDVTHFLKLFLEFALKTRVCLTLSQTTNFRFFRTTISDFMKMTESSPSG